MAGLWDVWNDPGGNWIHSYTIIITEANELLETVRSRMRVILKQADYNRWLERDAIEQLPTDLLQPSDSDSLKMDTISMSNGLEMLNSA